MGKLFSRMKPCLVAIVATLMAVPARAQTQAPAPVQGQAQDKPAAQSFFIFSDTELSYWHQFTASEPRLSFPAAQDVVTLRHIDAWKYGTNYVNIDLLKSTNKDPAAPWAGPGYPVPYWGVGDGALEVYGLYRGSLSLNQLTTTEIFTAGPLKDVSLYFGGDFNSKNTAMAPRKRDIVFGLQAAFEVPGYFNVAAVFYKEWNHNGIVQLEGTPPGTSTYVDYAATVAFEAQYMQPLTFTGIPLKISGNTTVTLPKGSDGFGHQTVTELLTDNRLTLDVGKLVADKPNLFDVFVGYRYWLNKFGDNPYPPGSAPMAGTMESTFYMGVTWHMF